MKQQNETKILNKESKLIVMTTKISQIACSMSTKELEDSSSLSLDVGDFIYHGSNNMFVYPFFPSNKDNRFSYDRNIALYYAKKNHMYSNYIGYLYTYKKKPNKDTEIPQMLLFCESDFIGRLTKTVSSLNEERLNASMDKVDKKQFRKNDSGEIDDIVSSVCDCGVNGIYFGKSYESQILLCNKVASKYFDLISITKIENNTGTVTESDIVFNEIH